MLHVCTVCSRTFTPFSVRGRVSARCRKHVLPARGRRYFDAARIVRATATRCALCGHGPRADDPWVADHVTPRAHGGSDTIGNLQPAHASCNARRGAQG